MLTEATLYKGESRREELERQKKGGEEAVVASLMADLQELHDMEIEGYIQQMPEKVSICNHVHVNVVIGIHIYGNNCTCYDSFTV